MIDGTGWKLCRMSAHLRRENAPYRGERPGTGGGLNAKLHEGL